MAVAHHDHKHSHGHSHQHGKHEASHSHHAHQESGENGSRQSPRPAKESCPCKQHGNTALVAVGEWTTSQQLTLSSQFELSLDNIVAVTISLANISFGPNSLATQGQAFPHMSCRDILRAIQTLRC